MFASLRPRASPDTGEWTTVAVHGGPEANSGHTATVIGNSYILIGGGSAEIAWLDYRTFVGAARPTPTNSTLFSPRLRCT